MQDEVTIETSAADRIRDMEIMRKSEKRHAFPSIRYEVKDILAELNLRFSQYNRQSLFGTDFKLLQTVHDFRNMLIPLQSFPKKKMTLNERIGKAKIDFSMPIAQLNGKMVYINKDANAFEIFTFEKP